MFLTPVREALEADTHALATQAAIARTGAGISHQAYALRGKILEVEQWLSSSPFPLYEVYPEVSFAVLLGTPARASKKTWAGMVERRNALEAAGITLNGIEGVATVVAAWTGRRIASRTARSFPDSPQLDPSGRPVAILA